MVVTAGPAEMEPRFHQQIRADLWLPAGLLIPERRRCASPSWASKYTRTSAKQQSVHRRGTTPLDPIAIDGDLPTASTNHGYAEGQDRLHRGFESLEHGMRVYLDNSQKEQEARLRALMYTHHSELLEASTQQHEQAQFYDSKMSHFQTSVGTMLEQTLQNTCFLQEKLDSLNMRLDERFDQLNNQLQSMYEQLTSKVDSSQEKQAARIQNALVSIDQLATSNMEELKGNRLKMEAWLEEAVQDFAKRQTTMLGADDLAQCREEMSAIHSELSQVKERAMATERSLLDAVQQVKPAISEAIATIIAQMAELNRASLIEIQDASRFAPVVLDVVKRPDAPMMTGEEVERMKTNAAASRRNCLRLSQTIESLTGFVEKVLILAAQHHAMNENDWMELEESGRQLMGISE